MSHRKVHFSVPIDHIEYLDKQWESRSRRARNGTIWRRMAVDRQRFRDRIERTAEILDRILDFEFRQLIYRERFENFVIPEEYERKQQAQLELQLSDDSGNSASDIDTILDDNKTSCQLIENHADTRQQQSQQQQNQQQQQTNTACTNRKKGRQRRRKRRSGRAIKRKNK